MLSFSTALANLVFVSCVLFASVDAVLSPPKQSPPISSSFAERCILIKQMPGLTSAVREVIALLKALGVDDSQLFALAHIGGESQGPRVCVLKSREAAQKAMANREKLTHDERFKDVELFPLRMVEEGEKGVPLGRVQLPVEIEIGRTCVFIEFVVSEKVREMVAGEQEEKGDFCLTLSTLERAYSAEGAGSKQPRRARNSQNARGH